MYMITAKQFSSGLPSKVKIGPVIFEVVLATEPTAPGKEEGERVPVYGMVNFKKAEITIDEDLSPAIQWQCFWHEVLHVVLEQAGLENDCEGEIDALAYKLLEILLDNGWLSLVEQPELPAPETTTFTSVWPYPFTMEKRTA